MFFCLFIFYPWGYESTPSSAVLGRNRDDCVVCECFHFRVARSLCLGVGFDDNVYDATLTNMSTLRQVAIYTPRLRSLVDPY